MAKATSIQVGVGFALLIGVGLAQACSTNEGGTTFSAVGEGGSTAAALAGGAGNSPSLGTGGVIGLGSAEFGGATGVSGTMVECTEGEDCTCPTVSVAVLGKPGQYGDKDSTAFMTWLDSSSAGTAKVDSYPERVPLTTELLAQYNVIILLGLGDDSDKGPFWTFDADEVAAMQDWVENKAGGLITLSGASGQPAEVDPNNQLIAFTEMSYVSGSWITPDCLNVSESNSPMCSQCCGNAGPIADFVRTDAVIADLSNSITWVGMHGGRSISAPEDAHVAATITANGTTNNVIVGKVTGTGRVLVFSDEWITYTSQWQSTSTDPSCTGYLPQDVYQTAQFWYNVIKWVQPGATCFKIVDKQDVVLW
jgi:hypothetical protein